MDIVHEEDVSFKELGLDSIDRIELDAMVELMLKLRKSNVGLMPKQQHIWQKQKRKQKLFR